MRLRGAHRIFGRIDAVRGGEEDERRALRFGRAIFPFKSYARCANNRPWANCYDKECVVDPKDPSKATCTCSVKENEGDYVMVTNSYSAETCTIGLWSSATLAQLDEVTTFIETHGDLLPHFPLKVLNADADTLGSMTPSSAR